MATLSYPIDDREAYQSRIRFTVISTQNALARASAALNNIPEDNTAAGPNNTAAANQALLDKKNEATLTDALSIAPKYEVDTSKDIVRMFAPIALQFDENVNYNTINLGALGADISAAIGAGESISASLYKGLTDGASSFVDFMKSGVDMASPAARVAAARFTPGQTLGGAVRLNAQASVNPNTRVLFDRVQLRTFAFNFKMIPTSRRESEEIEKIIKHFRTEMYPRLIAGNTGYEFPNAFRINISHKGTEAKFQKVPDCFLQRVNTTYNATTGAFHKDGYPSEVDVSLLFQEMAALDKDQVIEGM